MIRSVVGVSPGYPRTCCVVLVGLKLTEIFLYRHFLSNGIKDVHHYIQQCWVGALCDRSSLYPWLS